MCGDGLTEKNVCSNSGTKNSGSYISKSLSECKTMIDAIKNSKNPFGTKCPNNKGISHFVVYKGCNLSSGLKYDEGMKQSQCTCPSGKCGPSKCGGTIGGGTTNDFIMMRILFQ
jgi:hypothetical protein